MGSWWRLNISDPSNRPPIKKRERDKKVAERMDEE